MFHRCPFARALPWSTSAAPKAPSIELSVHGIGPNPARQRAPRRYVRHQRVADQETDSSVYSY
jgi:hypothetical protein